MATIILTGRLTADVKTPNGWSMFTVAEEKKFNSNKEQKANFFNCRAKLSEAQANYLKKGTKVEVVGNLDFETYEKEGVKYYTHSVFVYKVNFVSDGKPKTNSDDVPLKEDDNNTSASNTKNGKKPKSKKESNPDDKSDNDDLPF
jgi:single-strand DNA-binding protein